MKTKTFDSYLEKRLSKKEIVTIKAQAKMEKDVLISLQEDIKKALSHYMKKEEIGFNELQRRLDISPTQLTKIQNGKANLTLATIAHIFALLKCHPHIVIT